MLVSVASCIAASIRIDCNYKLVNFVLSECETSGLEVKNVNDTVTSISGTLGAIVSYKKIRTLKIDASPSLEYFPQGIEKFFPNLETLIITQSGLKQINAEDIKVFPNLTTLDLSGNQLEEINAKVFEFNDKIEAVNLSNNKLTNVGFDFLKFLKNLKTINLTNNACINETAVEPSDLKKIKVNLTENCLRRSSNYGLYFSFFLIILVAGFFLVMLISCIKWIVN